MKTDPTRWNPDHVARWICVVFGGLLIAGMVLGAVATVARRDYLQSTETFAGGILLGMFLVWYGSRTKAGQAGTISQAAARVRRKPPVDK